MSGAVSSSPNFLGRPFAGAIKKGALQPFLSVDDVQAINCVLDHYCEKKSTLKHSQPGDLCMISRRSISLSVNHALQGASVGKGRQEMYFYSSKSTNDGIDFPNMFVNGCPAYR